MANPEDTPKGQHFLLSPECRTLTVLDLAKMWDTTAYNWFERLRRWCSMAMSRLTASTLGGHIRPENKAEDRTDRRLKKYHNMKRLCALAIRQGGLGWQTFTRIILDRDSNAAWAAVRDHVSREATFIADEQGSYNDLAGLNELQRVNHSKAYQTDDGTNTNQVESFFSRFQRAYVGIDHRFSLKHFEWYVAELAWREDCRHVSNRSHTFQLLGQALSRPTSRYLCGYWRGNESSVG